MRLTMRSAMQMLLAVLVLRDLEFNNSNTSLPVIVLGDERLQNEVCAHLVNDHPTQLATNEIRKIYAYLNFQLHYQSSNHLLPQLLHWS